MSIFSPSAFNDVPYESPLEGPFSQPLTHKDAFAEWNADHLNVSYNEFGPEEVLSPLVGTQDISEWMSAEAKRQQLLNDLDEAQEAIYQFDSDPKNDPINWTKVPGAEKGMEHLRSL